MPKTADQAFARWQQGMSSPQASQNYVQGVQRFQGNPMALAAAPEALLRYAQHTAAAAQPGGRMAQGLNRADPNLWRTNATKVGAARLASGAQKGASKAQAAYTRLAPIWGQMRAAADALPKGGFANASARAAAALQVLMQATGKA